MAQCWLGDASVGMGLEHHGGSALGPPGPPSPQPVPAAPQSLGRRVPARGVPADHPPPGLDRRAGQGPPGLTRVYEVAGGGCGTPGWQKGMRWQTLAPGGNPLGMWAVGTWQGWPVLGNSNPSLGTRLRHDGREPRTTVGLTTSPTCWPHTPVPPGTPLLCPGSALVGGVFTTQKQPVLPELAKVGMPMTTALPVPPGPTLGTASNGWTGPSLPFQ